MFNINIFESGIDKLSYGFFKGAVSQDFLHFFFLPESNPSRPPDKQAKMFFLKNLFSQILYIQI